MEEGRGSGGDEIRKINIDGNSLGSPQPTKQFAVFVHPRLETDADISPRDNVLLITSRERSGGLHTISREDQIPCVDLAYYTDKKEATGHHTDCFICQ